MRTILSESEVRERLPLFEKTADLVDQLIDLMLNYRQSGHPGGSRSKVHLFLATLLSGAMRFDLRRPVLPFADRFVLAAGHCTPLLYSVLALLNEALRAAHDLTGDERCALDSRRERVLLAEDLLTFRRRGGLPGHAEMEGKTLFVKANTGPSGHGLPAAAGQALALLHAGARDSCVFALEGEGGLSTGAAHETQNSAHGLGLENFIVLLDWNDYGIDPHRASSLVHGAPQEWFMAHGWRVAGAERGTDFAALIGALRAILDDPDKHGRPALVWSKNIKGRGLGDMEGYKSHGAMHKANSEGFWATKRPFQEKYGVAFDGFGRPAPAGEAFREQTRANIDLVVDVLRRDETLVRFLAERLLAAAESVPERPAAAWFDTQQDPSRDERILDVARYPAELFAKPGDKTPNRAGLAAWGAHVNSVAREVAGRPLFLACSADLAESTNIAGFAKGTGGFAGFGWYERRENPRGALLPQQITEFANAAIAAHLATVNFAADPEVRFAGYFGACSTYGSFSYLKYGPMRLFAQLTQDTQQKTGKVLWVAGHSGPETAEDSRTHFGVFSPGVLDLFPRGQVIDLHPFDQNEVLALLAAALKEDAHIIALHLTRPAVEVPDRAALGADSFLAAARGAYVLKEWDDARGQRAGTVIFRGTSPVAAAFQLLKEHRDELPNVRFLAAPSRYLFERQPREYQERVLPWRDWQDSMVVTNMARRTLHDWLANKVAEEYTLSPDFDDRWRTGGTLEEVLDEAHLTWQWVLEGIRRFAAEHEQRMARLR
ncbi:MAG: transketolase [Planctomycetes bacterium]|nr:transketolase [Planctomycetota bacterium]